MRSQIWPFVKRFMATTWFDLAVIFLVGLLPLTWFRGSIIAGQDLPFPLASPNQLMREATSLWNPALGLGASDPSLRLLAFCLMNSIPHWLGISSVMTEKLLFVFWFTGAGLSTYFLIRVLVPRHRMAALFGALFYMMNPYTMVVRWYELNFWPFFYALLPLLLALFIQVIRTGSLRYVIGFMLTSLLISPAFANLGALVILSLVLGGYLVTYLIQSRHTRDKVWLALRYTLVLAILFVGIGMWWILPTAFSVRQEATIRQTPDTTMERVEFTSRNSTLSRVLRLTGYCWSDLQFGGTQDPAIPYAKSYENPLFGILGWFIPILGLAGLWKIRRYRGLVWPGILWIGGVFLMKGVQPPLGGLTKWMFQVIPGMSIFRHPFDKFGMLAVLGLAPLVGVGLEGLYRFTKSAIRKRPLSKIVGAAVLGIVAVILLVILVWPFWTGDIICSGGQVMPSYRIPVVPAEYQQARYWLEGQEDEFRILPLPYNRSSWVLSLFNWYMGSDPSRWLLGHPIVTPSSYPGGEFAEAAANEVLAGSDCGRRLCSLLNVKYVLLREDANWGILGGNYVYEGSSGYIFSPRLDMQESLNHQSWLEPAARFGDLLFYLNRDWQPRMAYATYSYQTGNFEGTNLLNIESIGRTTENSWQPIDQVNWSQDDKGNLSITSTSDTDLPWVGISRPIQLGEGPFGYSYELRTEEASYAHLRVEWYDQGGNIIACQFMQDGVYSTKDWTPYSGLLPKPPGASSANLQILMQPKQGANMQVRDLFLGEQKWIRAIGAQGQEGQEVNGDISSPASFTRILISGEDLSKLGLADNPMQSGTPPICTVERSNFWSMRVKVETESPCFLILNQAFDAGWRVYEGSPNWLKVIMGSQELPAKHFLANGYANAWYIDQPGQYELTLYYWPQTLLYLGIIISVLIWVFLGIWCFLRHRASRGKRWKWRRRRESDTQGEQVSESDADSVGVDL